MATTETIQLDNEDVRNLTNWLTEIRDAIDTEVRIKLKANLQFYTEPDQVNAWVQQVNNLFSNLGMFRDHNNAVVNSRYIPLIKTIVCFSRRRLASRLDEDRQRTSSAAILNSLDSRLEPYNRFFTMDWFIETEPYPIPTLADFITLERVEAMLSQTKRLETRIYDEKFHILQAPSLLMKDIDYYRTACELRENSIAVAYLDIDNFKAFNTNYGETTVDRNLLPVFMRRLEAFVYGRGHAYRFGGDEYVLLLPSAHLRTAVAELHELRRDISSLRYREVNEPTFISIGFCLVTPTCFLTNREIEERANAAKNYAKRNGKNCLASYQGSTFARPISSFARRWAKPVRIHDAAGAVYGESSTRSRVVPERVATRQARKLARLGERSSN